MKRREERGSEKWEEGDVEGESYGKTDLFLHGSETFWSCGAEVERRRRWKEIVRHWSGWKGGGRSGREGGRGREGERTKARRRKRKERKHGKGKEGDEGKRQ